ncbi:50S ribosomal protein L24 [Hibiscus syriacus]|uniref:50S ribosomal protein L24 n=1 Tax=Hibiscus syriacus TaxID=106335 RepID=A0A6A3D034_HIBSY|nr:50S ribosomal protein L24 [Hibiscus syriacus]
MERKECKPNSLPVLHKMHVKVGDIIKVISGRDKGKIGEISKTFKHNSTIVVKDINLKTKHMKSREEGQPEQIIKVYVLSKLLTEEAAYKFANANGIDLVSVITTTVAGPFLSTTVPSSIQVILLPVTAKGFRFIFEFIFHIEDICRASMFLMEQTRAEGKYTCCVRSCPMSEMINRLARENPRSYSQRLEAEEESSKHPEISSKKLRDLGFTYEHGLEDIIHQSLHV